MTKVDKLVRHPLVIVGPTASGKSALALAVASEVARRSGSQPGGGTVPTQDQAAGLVEIVSADAMAVYRGMDVGTAKPDRLQRSQVPHHGIDLVGPDEEFTVAEYQDHADTAMAGIAARGRVAIVVGGTGLYVRAVVDDFTMPGRFPDQRRMLEAEVDTTVLYRRLSGLDPLAATRMEPTNRRRIVRALEVTLGSGQPFSSFGPGVDHYPPTRFVQVGLEIERDELDRRIEARYRDQMEAGFLDEAAALAAGPLSRTAAQALGYRELLSHLAGECSLDEALTEAVRRTRRFARRQQRWFRRDPRIRWFETQDEGGLGVAVADWWQEQAERRQREPEDGDKTGG